MNCPLNEISPSDLLSELRTGKVFLEQGQKFLHLRVYGRGRVRGENRVIQFKIKLALLLPEDGGAKIDASAGAAYYPWECCFLTVTRDRGLENYLQGQLYIVLTCQDALNVGHHEPAGSRPSTPVPVPVPRYDPRRPKCSKRMHERMSR